MKPEDADALFFPGSGGKPHKAQEFCVTKCPVRNLCIEEAIQGNYQGFFGGFTDSERRAIGRVNSTIKNEAALRGAIVLPDDISSNTPLKIIEAPERDRSWMDEVEPDDSSLNLIELLGNDEAAWETVA